MMKNLIKIFGLLLMLTLTTGMYSQAQSKIESYKIGFFTDKLQLTPEESQSFWPIYNQYKEELKARKKDNLMNPRSMTLLSDEELERFFEEYLQSQEDEIALRRSFYDDLKDIIPTRKAVMVFLVEREFNKQLLQTVSKRRNKN